MENGNETPTPVTSKKSCDTCRIVHKSCDRQLPGGSAQRSRFFAVHFLHMLILTRTRTACGACIKRGKPCTYPSSTLGSSQNSHKTSKARKDPVSSQRSVPGPACSICRSKKKRCDKERPGEPAHTAADWHIYTSKERPV
jgi:hypothetical protein